MRGSTKFIAAVSLICVGMLCNVATSNGIPDGRETLVPIDCPDGSGAVSGGAGLTDIENPVSFELWVPGAVVEALLLWEGREPGEFADGDETIVVEIDNDCGGLAMTELTGDLAGDTPYVAGKPGNPRSFTFCKDVTEYICEDLNEVTVWPMDGWTGAEARANAVWLFVIYDDGSCGIIDCRKGDDYAFYQGWDGNPQAEPDVPEFRTTVPQTFDVSQATSQTVQLCIFHADVVPEDGRPYAIEVTIDDADPIVYGNVPGVPAGAIDLAPFREFVGMEGQIIDLPIDLPEGAEELTVEIKSLIQRDPKGASIIWTFAYLVIPCEEQDGCTLTQGYWKTHADPEEKKYDETWDELPSGPDTPFFDTGQSWIDTLWDEPDTGDAYLILAHQYIAAYLNMLAGADTTDVVTELAEAEVLLDLYDGNPLGKGDITDADRQDMIDLAEILDDFNNGLIGPGHCDDEEEEEEEEEEEIEQQKEEAIELYEKLWQVLQGSQ